MSKSEIDKIKAEFGHDIICKNCGISAYDYFVHALGEKVPDYFYNGMKWYCSYSCSDERTKDE